jgi:hypothetical protein
MSLQRAKDLVQSFNDGDYIDDIEPYFNDLMTFFRFVKKYNVLDEIDLGQIPSSEFDDELFEYLVENDVISNLHYDTVPEEFKNNYLIYGLENNYEDTIIYITNDLLSDVDIRPDGFYLRLSDPEDLSNFFCSGSRGNWGPKDISKKIFSEDGLDHEWYYDNHVKPSQVVDELDETKIIALKDIIFKEIGDVELSLEDYHSDFFEGLSEEQGTEGYFRIRPEDLNGFINDDDAINELFKNDLEELGSNLMSLYWNSENTAYEDEVYEMVYGGLEEFFEGRVDTDTKEITRTDGSKITKYFHHIKLKNFIRIVKTFLDNNKGETYSDSYLDYYGGFEELIKGMIYNDEIECIDFRIPEYPDWGRTRKNINEMFHDYL